MVARPCAGWFAGARMAQAGTGERTVRLTFTYRLDDGEGDTISFLPPYEVEVIGRVAPQIAI